MICLLGGWCGGIGFGGLYKKSLRNLYEKNLEVQLLSGSTWSSFPTFEVYDALDIPMDREMVWCLGPEIRRRSVGSERGHRYNLKMRWLPPLHTMYFTFGIKNSKTSSGHTYHHISNSEGTLYKIMYK